MVKVVICPRTDLTKAAPAVIREHETRLAHTLEAAGCVVAGAELADIGLGLALVDVWTDRRESEEEKRGGR